MKLFRKLILAGAPFVFVVSAHAQLTSYQEVTVGSTGSVTITGDGFTGYPSYQDSMGYVDPVTHQLDFVAYNWIGNHQVDSSSVTLTGLTAGSELELYLTNPNGQTFYTGPGSRNPDGDIHASVTQNSNGSFDVNFEDLAAPNSDFNYGDGHLQITGVQATPTPSSFLIFGMGAIGFLFRRRTA
jgi:hypothetical protein